MLGIRCATPVAKEHDLAAGANRLGASPNDVRKDTAQFRFRPTGDIVVFGKFGLEKCSEIQSFFL
jgi:hypothetical protein